MGRLAPFPPGWSPRRPETPELYEAVRSSASSFCAWVESAGSEVPGYVRTELEGFVRCGVPAYGFARVHCRTCGDDFVVAFSCKGRGFCPSCGARRMTETAARWVDRLLPVAPYRQWVLTVPWWLRARLAWDTALLTDVVGLLHAAVRRRLRLLGRRRGAPASSGLRIATGARAGKPVRRHRAPRGGPGSRQRKAMQAACGGVDIEAAVRLSPDDRAGLERVARYLLRPALSMERLRLRDDGLYEYALRRAWADGTLAVVLSAHELMEKLAALVPVPRAHLVRYHGVFAPNHGLRRVVVPQRTDGLAPCGRRPRGGVVPTQGRAPWAQLLRRVWGIDVLRCATCGSRRVVIAVHEPGAATRILEWLGLDSIGPQLAEARAPPDDDVA